MLTQSVKMKEVTTIALASQAVHVIHVTNAVYLTCCAAGSGIVVVDAADVLVHSTVEPRGVPDCCNGDLSRSRLTFVKISQILSFIFKTLRGSSMQTTEVAPPMGFGILMDLFDKSVCLFSPGTLCRMCLMQRELRFAQRDARLLALGAIGTSHTNSSS